jgi:hypothetical protein
VCPLRGLFQVTGNLSAGEISGVWRTKEAEPNRIVCHRRSRLVIEKCSFRISAGLPAVLSIRIENDISFKILTNPLLKRVIVFLFRINLTNLTKQDYCRETQVTGHFMEHKGSLPSAYEPFTDLYPEPYESSLHNDTRTSRFFKIHFSPTYDSVFQLVSLPEVLLPKSCKQFYLLHVMCPGFSCISICYYYFYHFCLIELQMGFSPVAVVLR